MDTYEMKCDMNELTDAIFSEIGTDMLDNKDEDTLKALKVIKLARKLIIKQNEDIEDLKIRLITMDSKMEKILYEIRRVKEEA